MARELMKSMTFKLELMLMDPANIKPSLIRRALTILNANQRNLNPLNVLEVDKGASILLTWVINFVKWHTGLTKYNFMPGQGDILNELDDQPDEDVGVDSHHQRVEDVPELAMNADGK